MMNDRNQTDATAMIDFDDIDDWAPRMAQALRDSVPSSISAELAAAAPEYVEDSRKLLFARTDRHKLIADTLTWLASMVIAGYHGSRLIDAEVEAIRSQGLRPLRADARRARLTRALSPHPEWGNASLNLGEQLERHGAGNRAGFRENQAHLTLSRCGLVEDFNHYLTHGSEFDQHVARSLLGKEGVDLLAKDGKARVIKFAVPGQIALKAAHPYFKIDDLIAKGEVPNIANDFIEVWSHRLAHPDFQSRDAKVDCGMVFRDVIPADWIVGIETLDDKETGAT